MSVRLVFEGRDDAPLAGEGALVPVSGEGPHEVVAGPNLTALRALLAAGRSYGLAYLDPPYSSAADYAHTDGRAAYSDKWSDRDAYLTALFPCLRLVHALLAPHGTIWVQVDHRASGLVQPLLDELFGAQRLRNVIAWRRAPPLGRQVQSGQFPRNLDLLFAYAKGDKPRWHPVWGLSPFDKKKARLDPSSGRYFTTAPRGDYTDESVARLEAEGRIHRTDSGKVYVKYWLEQGDDGQLYKPKAVDAVWDDVAPLRHASPKERTGYPTQKPEPLLARIVESTSDPGDPVLDPYAGSGTTGVVAASLGRPFTLVDQSPAALDTMRARLRDLPVRWLRT